MTEPVPILVVFGIDGEGKARASRFADRDAQLATKAAAALLGLRSAWIKDGAVLAIAEALREGNVFARGNGFVRPIRQPVFEKLSALIDGGFATTPEQRGSDDR
jgi:hypothetical protein